ncbi:MAG: TrbI/VirB10 family protein, partial [Hyphomonadaceae bacterium]
YELQAGHVIPAALVTALSSDLPGRVIAQVTAPVYDSMTGDHLLIPQGSRLIGTYRDGARYGDNRILLAWNRLILPNGWSINLQNMEASDPAGASGLSDRTDNHLDRLAAAVALSSIITVAANEVEDNESNGIVPSLGDAAAQQAAQTGSRIVDRELTVRPTLRIRAGAPVRVIVSRDIQLRPYR